MRSMHVWSGIYNCQFFPDFFLEPSSCGDGVRRVTMSLSFGPVTPSKPAPGSGDQIAGPMPENENDGSIYFANQVSLSHLPTTTSVLRKGAAFRFAVCQRLSINRILRCQSSADAPSEPILASHPGMG